MGVTNNANNRLAVNWRANKNIAAWAPNFVRASSATHPPARTSLILSSSGPVPVGERAGRWAGLSSQACRRSGWRVGWLIDGRWTGLHAGGWAGDNTGSESACGKLYERAERLVSRRYFSIFPYVVACKIRRFSRELRIPQTYLVGR